MRRRLDACEKACVGGTERNARRVSGRAGASWTHVATITTARRARAKDARAAARSPRRAISRRSVCFFHRFARRAIEGGGGVPRGDAAVGRGAHLTSVELECRGSTRVTREPPRVSRALECGRAQTRTLPSHAGPRTRLMNIAAIARATRETTQETTPGPDGESSDARSAQRGSSGTANLQICKTTRTHAMRAIFVNLTTAPRFLQSRIRSFSRLVLEKLGFVNFRDGTLHFRQSGSVVRWLLTWWSSRGRA